MLDSWPTSRSQTPGPEPRHRPRRIRAVPHIFGRGRCPGWETASRAVASVV